MYTVQGRLRTTGGFKGSSWKKMRARRETDRNMLEGRRRWWWWWWWWGKRWQYWNKRKRRKKCYSGEWRGAAWWPPLAIWDVLFHSEHGNVETQWHFEAVWTAANVLRDQNTVMRHHWVHRRRQDGKCKQCGKVKNDRHPLRFLWCMYNLTTPLCGLNVLYYRTV